MLKNCLFLFLLGSMLNLQAQDTTSAANSYPKNITDINTVENLGEVLKGKMVDFEFYTDFNKNVVLDVYDEQGVFLSSTPIEVYSEVGLSLTTRSFKAGIYYLHLRLKAQDIIKRIKVIE